MTPRASIVAIMIILLISVSFLSFRAGQLQGDAEPVTTTVTSTILIGQNGTVIKKSFFSTFIDDTPQLRVAWGLLPLNVSIDNFVMKDATNQTLISFNRLQGANNFESPNLNGLPIGFKALSHDVRVGDLVYITLDGHSGGAGVSWTYRNIISLCNPNVTWC